VRARDELLAAPPKAQLERLVEEAVVDAYNESEQRCGLFTMIEDRLPLPFDTEVLGVVTAERVDLGGDGTAGGSNFGSSFWALAGQGFSGGGSRNGIPHYQVPPALFANSTDRLTALTGWTAFTITPGLLLCR